MKIKLTIAALAAIALISCKTAKEDLNPNGSVKPYNLSTCIVSGEKLGEMGDPVVTVYQGQEIKFCCKSCVPKFEKNPEKYLEKLK